MPVFVFLLFASSLSFGKILSLNELYIASKNNIETLKKSESQLTQSLERKKQAQGALLPTLRFVANETRIDAPKSGMINRAFVLTRQYSTALRLEQPLLRGGSLAALQLTEEDYLLQKFLKNFEEKLLYQLVLRNYFDFLKAKIDLESLSELELLSTKREKELKHLTTLGRARKAELIQAEAQTLNAKASLHEALSYFKKVKENLVFLSGEDFDEVSVYETKNSEVKSLGYFQAKLNETPERLAKNQEVRIAEEQIKIAKGGHYPNVDFFSNYYFDRTGILQTSEWDLGVVVSFPLFQGGTVQSRIREVVEAKKTAQLSKYELDRTQERDLKILFNQHEETLEQIRFLKEAAHKAEESYKLNSKDYRLGLVTNLEVLQSLNLYIELKRNLKNLMNEAQFQNKNLAAFVGEIP